MGSADCTWRHGWVLFDPHLGRRKKTDAKIMLDFETLSNGDFARWGGGGGAENAVLQVSQDVKYRRGSNYHASLNAQQIVPRLCVAAAVLHTHPTVTRLTHTRSALAAERTAHQPTASSLLLFVDMLSSRPSTARVRTKTCPACVL